MTTFIIGDVQGCFDSLHALLEKIDFNPQKDQLGFAGDLVNRGPKSLETLRFIMQLKNPLIVLGNHDLHLLALHFLSDRFTHIPHTMEALLQAPDCNALIDFLLQQPFISQHTTEQFTLVHAGIPPQWTIDEAIIYAKEIHESMRHNPALFFQNMYGNQPASWDNNLSGWDRTRYIVNALTRMRFCSKGGELELENKTDVSSSEKFRPWFAWRNDVDRIYFGHWASLNGHCDKASIHALDTGCAWGGSLTAIRTTDQMRFSVNALEK
jgi:bis(5'-nucleosyl)-tetraphosphatase (symmetrical)